MTLVDLWNNDLYIDVYLESKYVMMIVIMILMIIMIFTSWNISKSVFWKNIYWCPTYLSKWRYETWFVDDSDVVYTDDDDDDDDDDDYTDDNNDFGRNHDF